MKIMNLALFALSYPIRKLRVNYFPFFIWIEPTNHCNFKCMTCPQGRGYTSEKGYIQIETYKKVIEELRVFSPMMISLHLGGEPLLHKDLPEMIRLAKEKGFEVTIASNAGLLTKEKSKELIEAGLDGITVNFTSSRENFEKSYKGAPWDKVLENMKGFLELKKTKGKPKPHFVIQVLSENGEDIAIKNDVNALKQLFYGLPCNSVITMPIHNWPGNYAYRSFEKNRYKERRKYSPCSHLWSSLAIRWNGDVVPCCRDLQGGMVLGNVNNESLIDIWNNDKIIDLRKKHRDFKYDEIAICKNCSRIWERTTLYNMIKNQIFKIPLIIKWCVNRLSSRMDE